ncbi:MAG: IclR family transcriptional regulator [Deltaproteobacteria bacterium]|nr:IclR family transcriptional regulator [Deltaproteobacteria bacterium]
MAHRYQAPSVRKAFQVLRLIADSDRGLGISELAKRLGISKSTVHGVTAALEEMEVITRNPLNKRYNLGYAILELSKRGLSKIPLREVARRHMEGLMEETGETVFLGILNGHHILILDSVESNKEIKITSPSGTRIPLSAGATGKLFLAYMEEEEALKYLTTRGLVKYTKNTITDLDSYLQETTKVRKRGFAIDREEYLQGVSAVAALIETKDNLLAAIWVVGFSSSLTDEKMEQVIEKTLHAADAISQELRQRRGS